MIHKLFKKKVNPRKDKLMSMTKKQKKDFLSNDFIDRMIKVEQRVSSSFGEWIKYKDTKCYMNLTHLEKDKYEKFLHSKKNRWRVILILICISLVALVFLSPGFTGNTINDSIGPRTSSFATSAVLIFVLVGLLFVGISFIIRKRKELRFNKKFSVIDDIVSKKRLIKKS